MANPCMNVAVYESHHCVLLGDIINRLPLLRPQKETKEVQHDEASQGR
jgi:hypothetical protein